MPLLRRWLLPWIQRYMARKAEDMIRRQMGMPPREKKSWRQRRAEAKQQSAGGADRQYHADGASRKGRRTQKSDEPIIPREYAEDVEFVEIKEFENIEVAAETVDDKGRKTSRRERVETQISDAEWVDIK